LSLLPDGYREGDVLEISTTRDEKTTEEAKKKTQASLRNLKKRAMTSRDYSGHWQLV